MKTIGKITTFIIVLAIAACAAVNLTIHIKSGEVKQLFNNTPAIEQPAEQTPTE